MVLTRLGVLAAVIVIIVVLNSGGDSGPRYPCAVQTFDDPGREHLTTGQTYELYKSNPPTTGPHAPQPADWGVHDRPVPKEMPIHNMEHGGVVIWYNCSVGDAPLQEAQCQQLRHRLAAVTKEARSEGKLVLMVPYPGMEFRIALTAWRTLDDLQEFDEARVRAFIDSYERRFNPEGL